MIRVSPDLEKMRAINQNFEDLIEFSRFCRVDLGFRQKLRRYFDDFPFQDLGT